MKLIDKYDVNVMLSEMEWDIEDKYEITKPEAVEACEFIIHELMRRTFDIEPVNAIPVKWLEEWLVDRVRDGNTKSVMVAAKILIDWKNYAKR